MRVAFRTGGGKRSGFGHVRRCLTLAEELTRLGASCTFLVHGDLDVFRRVVSAGYEAERVPDNPEAVESVDTTRLRGVQVVVVDSYELEPAYFRRLAETEALIVAIDDLGDRDLPVDLLVNGSVAADQLNYRRSSGTHFLLGPSYILLRSEFAANSGRQIAEQVKRVLISAGGSDPYGLTVQLIEWTLAAITPVHLDVVVGPLFGERATSDVRAAARSDDVCMHLDPPHLRQLMLAADLAVSGGGQTAYELAATSTPAIAIRLADNQTGNLRGLAASGTLACAGDARDPELEAKFKEELTRIAKSMASRASMSTRGRALVDGLGTTRVARAITELASKVGK